MHYVAVVDKDPDSAYGIQFPEVPGCFSAAGTEYRRSRNERVRTGLEHRVHRLAETGEIRRQDRRCNPVVVRRIPLLSKVRCRRFGEYRRQPACPSKPLPEALT